MAARLQTCFLLGLVACASLLVLFKASAPTLQLPPSLARSFSTRTASFRGPRPLCLRKAAATNPSMSRQRADEVLWSSEAPAGGAGGVWVRALDADAAEIARQAHDEEEEAEQDLMKAISKQIPTNDEWNLETVGSDLYNEWILQAVNTLTVKVSNSPLNDLKLWLWKKAAGDYNRDRISARIGALLDSAPIVVFGASYSPFTKKALDKLEKAGARYKFVAMNRQGGNSVAMRAYLAEKTGRTSLPSVWIGDQFIGGAYDGPVGGVAAMSEKELDSLLTENNAKY
uniref:Glutaredoxin domain-containing protein n=1 Tax=Lotharella globosa TaxID=91324 RepID=A0A6U3BFF1_9EUKA|eukprot:CAMPEP_0167802902 /NCGR_PEP_ID=MMETSP0111_2-20121227/19431_1 /TAXON_ID=91324 /ORGANISM="Lotharella globosa, Strain CCCM811" /LENGTH=284 /DNA_ID=CAMNT_0007699097 /DNA_START=60 /DNA_END=914 /DNA_ORIENTATION=-